MATTNVGPIGSSSEVEEPRRPGTSAILLPGPRNRRYLTWFTIASISISIVWGVLGILLPLQFQTLEFANWFTGADATVDLQALTTLQQQVSAGTATATAEQQRLLDILSEYNAAKATNLSITSSVAVAITMLLQPIIGTLSDRTRSRSGRRAPWILFGGLIGSLALAFMPIAPSVVMVGVLFTIAQVILNFAATSLNATVADRVASDRRGTASALAGFGSFFGAILGAGVAGLGFAALGFNLYIYAAIIAAAFVTAFVLFARDTSSLDLVVPKASWKDTLVGFTLALRSSDFRWVWLSRCLLIFGNTVSTTLSLYMLQSYVQPALDVAEATTVASLLTISAAPCTLVAVLVAGRISDKVGRRKPFVIIASVLMACSMLIPIISPTVPAMFVQVVLAGLAYGIFLPVDQALFIDVIPDLNDAGRDLAVAGMSNGIGQALGPMLAGAVVAITGGYLGIWAAAFVLVAIAAVVIIPVRKAR